MAEETYTADEELTAAKENKTAANLPLHSDLSSADPKNTLAVQYVTMTKYGDNTQVYAKPDLAETVPGGKIAVGDPVHISGTYGDWYSIEYFYKTDNKRGTAFVKKASVKDTP